MFKPTAKDRIYWLQLIKTNTIGSVTFFKLIKQFGSAQEVIKAIPDIAKRTNKKINIPSISKIEKELELLKQLNEEIIFFGEDDYPFLLTQIAQPPLCLYIKGNKSLLSQKSISIVGTRNASLNALKITKQITTELGNNGLIIVSGLALGIDAEAHANSIDTGTIAVMPSGASNIYPSRNARLYNKILDNGLIISELPPNTKILTKHFPMRNRIVSGLSSFTVVVEAGLKSGAMITANLAIEQNREVFVIPGSPLDLNCSGNNKLLIDGAILVRNADDILQYMQFNTVSMLEDQNNHIADNIDEKIDINKNINLTQRKLLYKEIIEKLSFSPTSINELVNFLQKEYSEISSALMELEIIGTVVRTPGNKVQLT